VFMFVDSFMIVMCVDYFNGMSSWNGKFS
jgi:hypothetical protein